MWDAYALKLDTIDTDKRTGSEVIHWIMKYPVRFYMWLHFLNMEMATLMLFFLVSNVK